ncbi:hypothetical protein HC766_04670 [Candidatus Gracilibacteria bacterium]|nr:hypothetical protein [Candidatus Gracilibacteria bacterium]NJS41610.1 hypothetical protein [Candidatus Gracilibacteria bacterium]
MNIADLILIPFGSSKPDEIIANKSYVNYWTADKGGRDRPVFKLSPQLGEMRPDWCGNRLIMLAYSK